MATAGSPGSGQKIESNTPLHGGLQLSKITKKKKNHVPYNMRCWKCCPPSSTDIWHLFRKCAFTCINPVSEIQPISRLILAFSSSNVWGFATCIYGGTWKITCKLCNEPLDIRIIESKYQAWNWLYFGNWINACKCTFPEKMPEICGWRRTTFPTSPVIGYVIIFLFNFTQL